MYYSHFNRTSDLSHVVKANVNFPEETIDTKFNLMGASKLEFDNLNKIRQILSIFHNYHNMGKDKPEIKTTGASINKLMKLTEGIDSEQWVRENIYGDIFDYIRGEPIRYSFIDKETQLFPYIVIRYLLKLVSKREIQIYYDLEKNLLHHNIGQANIAIVTGEFVFIIRVRGDRLDDLYYSIGDIIIVKVDWDRTAIQEMVKHPTEILKAALDKTETWEMEALPDTSITAIERYMVYGQEIKMEK